MRRNTRFSRRMVVSATGAALSTALILATLEVAHRGLIPTVTSFQKYILAMETVALGYFLTEGVADLASRRAPERRHVGARLHLTARIVGYSVVVISVISILASNPALGVSIGAVVGVAIAFATQSVITNVLDAIVIFNTRMVRIGEEITVAGFNGTVIDIGLTHTLVREGDDIVYVPNTVMVSSAVKRKRRETDDRQVP